MNTIIATVTLARFGFYDDNPKNCYGLYFEAGWEGHGVSLFTANGHEILQAMKKSKARCDKDIIGCSVLLTVRPGYAEFNTFY